MKELVSIFEKEKEEKEEATFFSIDGILHFFID